mmetsp:Transcript_20401/g.24519  ORF Transcript_20401/g.24519 Transcript_20401/m.24519 type:complete len:255 (+) Transcript_20401:3-767(+)
MTMEANQGSTPMEGLGEPSSNGSSNDSKMEQCLKFLKSYQSNLQTGAELLFPDVDDKKMYWDRSHYDSPDSQMMALQKSSTLYVGNMAFTTRTEHVLALFGQIGPVAKVVLGLDRFKKTPCGFCFVEYEERRDALDAISDLSGTMLGGKPIRVELDAGFKPGRQYGRGVTGGQVRDDRRKNNDPARRHGHAGAGAGSGNRGGRTGGRGQPSRDYYGRPPPPPGPPPSAGMKRDRDDDVEPEGAPPSKDSRFRED